MRESRTSGSVRGGRGNPVPYRYNGLNQCTDALAMISTAIALVRLGRNCVSFAIIFRISVTG